MFIQKHLPFKTDNPHYLSAEKLRLVIEPFLFIQVLAKFSCQLYLVVRMQSRERAL